ncbi:MAG: carbohydrate kinase [Gammaproteobacteria bacterium]|jgi:fructokinase
MSRPCVCIFGEVLFDHFPDGKHVLGGAPFNVAWHLQAFGAGPRFISRVGADAEGDAVLAAMRDWGMDTSGVQTDPDRATGRVTVQIVDDEPSYDIVDDCAYDAIEAQPGAVPADAFIYHGTLAIRSTTSRQALDAITRTANAGTIFLDVNLRPPWWDREDVLVRVRAADWVKLNTDELSMLAPAADDRTAQARDFLAGNELQGLILTHGADGASVYTADGACQTVQPGDAVSIVDTVGAGDAFTAVSILGIISGWPLTTTLERAQAFASRIVGRRGATVDDSAFYKPLIQAWGLP